MVLFLLYFALLHFAFLFIYGVLDESNAFLPPVLIKEVFPTTP